MNLRSVVGRASIVAQVVAGTLVAISAVRFGVRSVAQFLESRRPHAVVGPVASATPAPKQAPTVKPLPKPQAKGKHHEPGDPVRVTLEVALGPPRSEVYVNGRFSGHTPFLGDLPCKFGEGLKVQIVPTTAEATLTFDRTCAAQVLHLTGDSLRANDPLAP